MAAKNNELDFFLHQNWYVLLPLVYLQLNHWTINFGTSRNIFVPPDLALHFDRLRSYKLCCWNAHTYLMLFYVNRNRFQTTKAFNCSMSIINQLNTHGTKWCIMFKYEWLMLSSRKSDRNWDTIVCYRVGKKVWIDDEHCILS